MCWQTYCCHCSLSLSAGWVPAADCWSCLGGTSRESLTSSSDSQSHSHSPTPSPLADQIQAWYTTDLKRLEGTFCPWLPITGLLFRGKVCRTVGEGESLTHPFPGSLAGAVIDLPLGTQQVASEVKKKRQKERKGSNNLWITATMERERQQNNASLSHSPLQRVATSTMGGVGPQRIRSRSLSSGERKE